MGLAKNDSARPHSLEYRRGASTTVAEMDEKPLWLVFGITGDQLFERQLGEDRSYLVVHPLPYGIGQALFEFRAGLGLQYAFADIEPPVHRVDNIYHANILGLHRQAVTAIRSQLRFDEPFFT